MCVSLRPASAPPPGGAARLIELASPFRMRRGGALSEAHIAYECWGELNAAGSNAVLLFTGLSPPAHACSSVEDPSPGWWEYMVGPGKPIDTDRWFVVCVNSLGSCFGSTGPASLNPATGKAYRLDFPELSIEDIATAAHEVVRALGIERLRAVVGASLGGMSALAYAIQFPDAAENMVTISAAARATAFALAIRSLQREIIRADADWKAGCYADGEQPVSGMRRARKLGLLSYRSAAEFQQRFGHLPVAGGIRELFGIAYEVESYLEYNARKFAGNFDANCYLYLSRAMDLFDTSEHGGSIEAGLARIQARHTLVIGVESDILFPLAQQHEIADTLRQAGREVEFHALASINGHDSFLIDHARFAPVVAGFFAGL